MKKLFIASLFMLAGLVSPVFAVSWNGLFDNSTKFSENHDFSAARLNQANGLYLSVNVPINKTMSFKGEGLYKFVLDGNFKSNKIAVKNVLDVDLFQFSGKWKINDNLLNVKAGRFYTKDITGSFFAQVSDGLYANFDMAKMSAGFYAGFTGLLNRLDISMTENGSTKNDILYGFCPKYIPVMVDFSYKTLLQRQTLSFQLADFIPLSAKLKNKLYTSVAMKGPISTTIAYNGAVTFGMIGFKNLMFDGNVNVNFYPVNNMMFTAGCEVLSWASGTIVPYVSITSRAVTNDTRFTGGILPKVSFMYAKDALYATATGKGVIALGKNAGFHGLDFTGSVVYNIFSDLQVGCDVAAFIGISAFNTSNYSATIKAVLSF